MATALMTLSFLPGDRHPEPGEGDARVRSDRPVSPCRWNWDPSGGALAPAPSTRPVTDLSRPARRRPVVATVTGMGTALATARGGAAAGRHRRGASGGGGDHRGPRRRHPDRHAHPAGRGGRRGQRGPLPSRPPGPGGPGRNDVDVGLADLRPRTLAGLRSEGVVCPGHGDGGRGRGLPAPRHPLVGGPGRQRPGHRRDASTRRSSVSATRTVRPTVGPWRRSWSSTRDASRPWPAWPARPSWPRSGLPTRPSRPADLDGPGDGRATPTPQRPARPWASALAGDAEPVDVEGQAARERVRSIPNWARS